MELRAPLDQALRSRSHVRVLRALEALPRGFAVSAREVARRAGVSHPTASAVLASLRDQGLVVAQRAPHGAAIQLNRDHVLAAPLVALFDHERRSSDELVSLLREELRRHTDTVRAAYLFGSAARGELAPRGDIDLAVVSPGSREEEVRTRLEPVADAVRRRFGNEVSLVVATSSVESLRRPGRPGRALWRRIVEEGIPLLRSAERTKAAVRG